MAEVPTVAALGTAGGGHDAITCLLHVSQYKAYFRWQHDTLKIEDYSSLPTETEACASVTACFLQARVADFESGVGITWHDMGFPAAQVLQTLFDAEGLRTVGLKRNILEVGHAHAGP